MTRRSAWRYDPGGIDAARSAATAAGLVHVTRESALDEVIAKRPKPRAERPNRQDHEARCGVRIR
jgi:hypothetical protein